MNDYELEDLESRLYSQVYHSTEPESAPVITPATDNIAGPSDNMKRRPNQRYFRNDVPSDSPKPPGGRLFDQRPRRQPDFRHVNNYKPHHQSDISINQLVVLNSPQSGGSGFVCFQDLNKPYQRTKRPYLNKKAYGKEQRRKATIAAKLAASPKPKFQQDYLKSYTEKIMNYKRPPSQQSPKLNKNDIVVLSDSDEDGGCVLIPPKWPHVTVNDSDEDKNKSGVSVNNIRKDDGQVEDEGANLNQSFDDVIFVEPTVTVPEIINLDEVPDQKQEGDDTSVTSSTNSKESKESVNTKLMHKERKELLNTPDSTSNDFLLNPHADPQHIKFNFGLHGSDFGGGDSQFVRPNDPVSERCETESSSSVADISGVKTIVFSEIEFPREDLFSEANLEKFGKAITPVRKRAVKLPKEIATSETQKKQSSEPTTQNVYASSNSSSESDFEEDPLTTNFANSSLLYVNKRTLPNLSPMVVKGQDLSADMPQKSSKKAKKSSLTSKYDLINQYQEEYEMEQPAQKAIKKRKSPENSETDVSVKKKRKKKKKKKNKADDVIEDVSKEQPIAEVQESPSPGKDEDETEPKESCQFAKSTILQQELVGSKLDNIVEPTLQIKQEKPNNNSEGGETESTMPQIEIKTENDGTLRILQVEEDSPSHIDSLKDFVVVDEVSAGDNEVVASATDSDSVLSELQEEAAADIKLLNLSVARQSKPSTSSDPPPDLRNTKPTLSLKDHSVQEIQRSMSDNPAHWRILDSDRVYLNKASPRGKRCNKCRETGHMAMRCPNKVEPKCALCGTGGHYEPRCPNKLCYQCGERSNYSTNYCKKCFKYRHQKCKLCFMPGHAPESCPDLWRRYHLTTAEGPVITAKGPNLRPRDQQWCSGCSRPGHLEFKCRDYNSPYPPLDPRIKSYDDVYGFSQKSQETVPDLRDVLDNKRRDQQEQIGPQAEGPRDLPEKSQQIPQLLDLQIPPPPQIKAARGFQSQNHLPFQAVFSHPQQTGSFAPLTQQVPLAQGFTNVPNLGVFDPSFLLQIQSLGHMQGFNQNPVPFIQHSTPIFSMIANRLAQNMPYMNNASAPPASSAVVHNPNDTNRTETEQVGIDFNDKLPDFIGFDTPAPSENNTIPPIIAGTGNKPDFMSVSDGNPSPPDFDSCIGLSKAYVKEVRQFGNFNAFVKRAITKLHRFISREMSRLQVCKVSLTSAVKVAVKDPSYGRGSPYFNKVLNMVLFGLNNFQDGKIHFEHLKEFVAAKNRTKRNIRWERRREELFASYTYVFGVDRHRNINYEQLLSIL